jgi:PTH1 family peptidyl-tRNA hydrolase
MLLLVGLGNPGPQYRQHRHNVGFMVLDRLQSRVGSSEWRDKYSGLSGRGVIAGREAILLKPQTFMNLSGRAVLKAVSQHGIKPADIVVVHDDLDLPYGTVRVKVGGGHGGHNGLRDISAAIGPDYLRVRVGIGRPAVGTVEAFVLSAFSKDEQLDLERVLDEATDALEALVAQGPGPTMNKVNTRKK